MAKGLAWGEVAARLGVSDAGVVYALRRCPRPRSGPRGWNWLSSHYVSFEMHHELEGLYNSEDDVLFSEGTSGRGIWDVSATLRGDRLTPCCVQEI